MCLSLAIDRPEDVLGEGTHKGFQWTIMHNRLGFRCGYVRVPKGHPWHGKESEQILADVHGGITFVDPDVPCGDEGPDDAYWIGFDCAHAGDGPDLKLPGNALSLMTLGGQVRSQEYVKRECMSLCVQALEAQEEGL